MGAVIGPPGEAMEGLDSPYRRSCAVVPVEPTGCLVTGRYRHEDVTQGRSGEFVPKEDEQRFQDKFTASSLGDVVMPISSCEVCQFWPFPLSSAFANYDIVL